MNFDFNIFLSIHFDESKVDYRLVALNNWAHEVADDLEANWGSIFNLNVEVGHALSSFLGLNNNI
jgi:hypothetical protein